MGGDEAFRGMFGGVIKPKKPLDPSNQYSDQLKRLQNNVETLMNSGLNEEILAIYLAFKLKMSLKKVRVFLTHLKNFSELLKKDKS